MGDRNGTMRKYGNVSHAVFITKCKSHFGAVVLLWMPSIYIQGSGVRKVKLQYYATEFLRMVQENNVILENMITWQNKIALKHLM